MTIDNVRTWLVGAQSEAGCHPKYCRVAAEEREGSITLFHWAVREYPSAWFAPTLLERQGETRRKELLRDYLQAGHAGRAFDLETGKAVEVAR